MVKVKWKDGNLSINIDDWLFWALVFVAGGPSIALSFIYGGVFPAVAVSLVIGFLIGCKGRSDHEEDVRYKLEHPDEVL